MSIARASDGLLSARATLELVTVLSRRTQEAHSLQFIEDFSKGHGVSRSKIKNTLNLLTDLSLVTQHEERLAVVHGGLEASEWTTVIQNEVARYLCVLLARRNPTTVIQYRQSEDELWLDSQLLPGFEIGLPAWIVDFGIATRNSVLDRFWCVNSGYRVHLLETLRSVNLSITSAHVSIESLQTRLRAQEEAGRRAEEWVLNFERMRLAAHPLQDQVRSVSDHDVTAGFDILSFSTPSALAHDLYIEVKSFLSRREFYWSRNEVKVANELGERYSLYLVDRNQMLNPGYAPVMISNPCAVIFAGAEAQWIATPESYHVTPIKPENE